MTNWTTTTHPYIGLLNQALADVQAIEDPIEQTKAWTEVMSWLQEALPGVRYARRHAAYTAKKDTGLTFMELAGKLNMTESTVRRLVSEAEK